MCKTIKQRVKFKAAPATLYDLLADSRKHSAVTGRKATISRKIGGTFTAGGTEISALVIILTAAAGRPVLDKTGLTGGFDIDLKWTPALGTDAPAGADAVSIFTAVQEQLGLRLENGSAPLDVLVIDRIERPSEN